jgi:hypothetical protein
MPNVVSHKDFIGVYDEVLSLDECNFVIDEFNLIEAHQQVVANSASMYGGELQRKDFCVSSSETTSEAFSLISERLHKSLLLYCDHYFLLKGIKASSLTVKLQRTPPRGGYHIWHCEQDSLEYANRVLVWTIYLNDVPYNEGETEFLWQGVRVNPKAGRCAIWPASFTHHHRGNPVYTHDKYIATGWYTLI